MTLLNSAEISCQADRFGYDGATIYSRILCVLSVKRINSFIHYGIHGTQVQTNN